MKFKGDIIITDPCYIIKDRSGRPSMEDYRILKGKGSKKFSEFTAEENEAYAELGKAQKQWERDNPDDWERCSYGDNMEALGIKTYLCRDTIYGDWSCHTYNSDTKEDLGSFCADAGLVAVFLLEEVLKYNPDFNYHTEKLWTTTLIKDFDGDIEIDVVEVTQPDNWNEEDYGEFTEDQEVRVIGTGNINFFTTQTGL